MTDTATHMNGSVAEKVRAVLSIDDLRSADWRVELPDGQWVKFRDPEKITESQRRAFKEAGFLPRALGDRMDAALAAGNFAAVEALARSQAAAVVRSDYVAVAMFVESWSFNLDVPTPHDPDSLGQLDGVVFDRLNRWAEVLTRGAFFDDSVDSKDGSPFVNSPS